MTAGALRSVVLAGGGTAGHVSPMLALADELTRRNPGVAVTGTGRIGSWPTASAASTTGIWTPAQSPGASVRIAAGPAADRIRSRRAPPHHRRPWPSAHPPGRSAAMVENNASAILFGQSGQNKGGYLDILSNSAEGHEGLVRLSYRTFLGREPSTYEAYTLTTAFRADHDLQRMQRKILTSDEYAGLSNNQQ